MLVAAGPRAQDDRARSRMRTRRRSTPTRRSSTSCRRTCSRARRSTSPRCSTLAEALVDARPRLRHRRRATSTTPSPRSRPTAQLSGNTLDDLRAGHRGEVEPDKRDAADFALWKAAGEGRAPEVADARGARAIRAGISSARRWRCGTWATRFDLHTGGIDNVFPHHEDELAQSAPIVGGPPARHWVHGEHLLASGQKMAKSAGNFERVTELPDGVEPLALRYLAMTVRYRQEARLLDGVDLGAAAAALGSLRSRLAALGPPPPDGPWARPDPCVAGAAPARPAGIAAGLAGHGDAARGRLAPRPRPRALGAAARRGSSAPRPVRRGARRRPRPAGRALGRARDPAHGPPGRRAAVAGPRRGHRARAGPRSGVGCGAIGGGASRAGASIRRQPRWSTSEPGRGRHATGPPPTRSGTGSRRWASRSRTAPTGRPHGG